MAAVEVSADAAAVARAAAVQMVELAVEAVAARGRFVVALSGGSTPKALYELLATDDYACRIEWPRVHVFFGDERCVPPDDPQSNERMVRIALLDRVALPPANIHPLRCSAGDAAEAAARHDRELRSFLRSGAGTGSAESAHTFDLVLLGMGANGHTASLFPGLSAVHETERWVVAQHVAEVGQWRLTLTPPVINAARVISFLVTGADKAAMLRRVLDGPRDAAATPAQAIVPQSGGTLRWLVDAAAAGDLEETVSA